MVQDQSFLNYLGRNGYRVSAGLEVKQGFTISSASLYEEEEKEKKKIRLPLFTRPSFSSARQAILKRDCEAVWGGIVVRAEATWE